MLFARNFLYEQTLVLYLNLGNNKIAVYCGILYLQKEYGMQTS
jgi:hypothetical protein